MRRWLLIGVAIFTSIVGGVAAASFVADLRWNRETRRSVVRLHRHSQSAEVRFSRDDLAGLPGPVKRYFDFALTSRQSVVHNARLRPIGTFAMRPKTWIPFTAVEYFSVEPRGFLWGARIRLNTIRPIFIRDGYSAGEGAMLGQRAAVVPVVNQRGTSEMASGEPLRYLAELVFLPTAMLPRGCISWKPLDDKTTRVILTDGATTVSGDVDFGERGEIVRISAMGVFRRKGRIHPMGLALQCLSPSRRHDGSNVRRGRMGHAGRALSLLAWTDA